MSKSCNIVPSNEQLNVGLWLARLKGKSKEGHVNCIYDENILAALMGVTSSVFPVGDFRPESLPLYLMRNVCLSHLFFQEDYHETSSLVGRGTHAFRDSCHDCLPVAGICHGQFLHWSVSYHQHARLYCPS